MMQETACPLCYSAISKLLLELNAEKIIREWASNYRIDVREEFGRVSTLELRECKTCGLRYFLPLTVAGTPRLYEALDKFDWYYLPRKWEHQAALEDLEGCKNGIEIGCGFGDFVVRAGREKMIPFEGCEQNPNAVEMARNKGFPVLHATAEDLAKSRAGSYSAVCSFQVLEHLSRPADFLEAACRLLSPGGKLMLGLPNAHSFLRHQFNILDMPPHHMTRWTAEVLARLQTWFPLKLHRIAYEPLADYHVEGYVQAYTKLLANRGLSILTVPGISSRIIRLIRQPWIQKRLLGQTIYVCYVRT